jgi:hypothetical protein
MGAQNNTLNISNKASSTLSEEMQYFHIQGTAYTTLPENPSNTDTQGSLYRMWKQQSSDYKKKIWP